MLSRIETVFFLSQNQINLESIFSKIELKLAINIKINQVQILLLFQVGWNCSQAKLNGIEYGQEDIEINISLVYIISTPTFLLQISMTDRVHFIKVIIVKRFS